MKTKNAKRQAFIKEAKKKEKQENASFYEVLKKAIFRQA